MRLIPPAYAKAYERRNKSDPADAAAICEAVSRPSMRFVTLKEPEQQAAAGLHRVHERLVKQRTMLTNQLRGRMAEFGGIAVPGRGRVNDLLAVLADPQDQRIPAMLAEALMASAQVLRAVEEQIVAVDKLILAWGRANETCRHLRTIPGFGPLLASAMAAEPRAFRSGRDFAASLGLVPRQIGTGGKVHLGSISKRGNGYLRRLLVNGAMSVLSSKRARQDPWLVKMLETKKRKVVAVALANKMARIAWAVMLRQEDFRPRPAAA